MARKRKYAGVVQTLDPLPVADQTYQDKIEAIKVAIVSNETHTPESLAKNYIFWRTKKDQLKAELAAVQEQVTAFEQLLSHSYDCGDEGWGMYGAHENTVKLPNGSSVAVQLEPAAVVEDREAFRQWCIRNGYERELRMWPSTTLAITNERLLADPPLPAPDGVKSYVMSKIVYRKG